MKLKRYVYCLVCLGALTSCTDQMNYKEYNDYDRDYIAQEFSNVGGLMTTMYRQLDADFGNYGGAVQGAATDEAEYAYTSSTVTNFYNGSWSPTNAMESMWTSCYSGISNCNYYLRDFVGLTFPDYKYNSDYEKQMARYQNYEWEVRFLRAYFYFNLVRQYGAVPFTETALTGKDANELTRKPAQEIFQWIEDQCDETKEHIVKDYSDRGDLTLANPETGRANRLTVIALKARTALYAASPLFNTDNNQELWHKAATANKELLDEAKAEGKSLAISYAGLFAHDNYQNTDAQKEIIFLRRMNKLGGTSKNNAFEKYNFPVGVEGGQGGTCPTQDLVDAYEMQATGEPYSGDYNTDADPYAGRDPRFAATIAKNGDTKWPAWNTNALETFQGGRNGQPLSGATPTGYYLKKYVNGEVDLRSNKQPAEQEHNWVTFRLGEFYLNYAEAVFRYLGDPYKTTSEFPMSAVEAVNKIRERSSMPDLPQGLSNAEFWEKYKNERRVELAFEGHRFWDVRRWKEADKYFKSITEMHITKDDATGKLTYTRKTVDRQWNDKMYLFPIPQSELMKNTNLTQNPGW